MSSAADAAPWSLVLPARADAPGLFGAQPDGDLLAAIRREIDESPFVGGGDKKIFARLRLRGIDTASTPVLATATVRSTVNPVSHPTGRG